MTVQVSETVVSPTVMDAVMTVLPDALPVTTPLLSTVPLAVVPEDQVIVLPAGLTAITGIWTVPSTSTVAVAGIAMTGSAVNVILTNAVGFSRPASKRL